MQRDLGFRTGVSYQAFVLLYYCQAQVPTKSEKVKALRNMADSKIMWALRHKEEANILNFLDEIANVLFMNNPDQTLIRISNQQ